VSGILRGFDIFLNLVLDQAYEELGGGQRKPTGMVVSATASDVTGWRGVRVEWEGKRMSLVGRKAMERDGG
jgi:small nuclear ribonucleoprotein (snRNP)-like protein